MSIHVSAVIHPDAQVAEDVDIGPFCFVEANVVIGSGCRLFSHVTVKAHTELGRKNVCHAGSVFGDYPQDLSFDPSCVSSVKIGDGNTFREGFTVHRGGLEGSETVIGSGGYYMANSHVAHNCVLEDGVIMANGSLLGGHVELGERAFISGNAVIHQFVRIGRLAMVSGLSALSKEVPPFCTSRGGYTNVMAGLNTVGLRRAGFKPDERAALRKAFRRVFFADRSIRTVAEELGEEYPDGVVQEFATFILSSKRGVCGVKEKKG